MATHLYRIDVNCLNCNKTFDTLKVRAKSCTVVSKDTDFCNYYKDSINPYFYEVYVCPQCGFAFTKNFNENITEDARRAFNEQVAANWYKRHQYSFARSIGSAIEANKLAILTANIVNERSWVIAGLALRLGWFYRYQNNQEQEQKFLSTARKLYIKAYENDGLSGFESPEINLIYLLGELSSRIGDYEGAIKWYSKVTEHEHKELHKALVDQARDRWQDVRGIMKKAQ